MDWKIISSTENLHGVNLIQLAAQIKDVGVLYQTRAFKSKSKKGIREPMEVHTTFIPGAIIVQEEKTYNIIGATDIVAGDPLVESEDSGVIQYPLFSAGVVYASVGHVRIQMVDGRELVVFDHPEGLSMEWLYSEGKSQNAVLNGDGVILMRDASLKSRDNILSIPEEGAQITCMGHQPLYVKRVLHGYEIRLFDDTYLFTDQGVQIQGAPKQEEE